jgi:hypothetical protein
MPHIKISAHSINGVQIYFNLEAFDMIHRSPELVVVERGGILSFHLPDISCGRTWKISGKRYLLYTPRTDRDEILGCFSIQQSGDDFILEKMDPVIEKNQASIQGHSIPSRDRQDQQRMQV